MKNLFQTRSLVTMALFAAILCISAYISIPLPSSGHITLQNFILFLIVLIFPVAESAFSTIVWFLLGAIGIPVFIGGAAGIGYLTSEWGGYTVCFILVSIIVPLILPKKYNRIIYTLLILLAALFIDFFGCVWFMIKMNLSFTKAFAIGFLPFIPLDVLKSVIAAQIIPQFRTILKIRNEE